MKRRLFNLLTAVSLVLCMAMVALWVRTYWVEDVISHLATNRAHVSVSIMLFGRRGSVGFQRVTTENPLPEHGWQWMKKDRPPVDRPDTVLGFRFERGSSQRGSESRQWMIICIPLLLPALMFAGLPSWWLVRQWRRWAGQRAVAMGCCKECGYDLRATSQRCPECGAIPADAPRGKIPA